VNIRRLTLETNHLDTLKEFYGTVLELPALLENHVLRIQIGTSELVFLENPNSNAKYHIAFNIPESQIKTALTWLETRVSIVPDGTDFIADFPNWNAHAIYFYDPAGNILELIARHELSHSEIEPFDSRGLLCISEIGMAVPDATEFSDWIEEILGMTRYRAGSSSFTPIGDAHGLIIAVLSGREWHPNTGIIAKPFYTKIEFMGEGLPWQTPTVQYLDLPYWFMRVQQ
jgi:catechol-2,3-dioxygenase